MWSPAPSRSAPRLTGALLVAATLLLPGACGPESPRPRPPLEPALTAPRLDAVDPPLGDPLGGSWILVTGSNLLDASLSFGGQACAATQVLDPGAVRCQTPALPSGVHDVQARSPGGAAELLGAYEAWSPAELPGAHLFDASFGLAAGPPDTAYEWQRLTADLHPDWRARDGNTLTWLPSSGRFWMVGGWNPYDDPTWPGVITTDEVWSSPDGVRWTLERPHGHGAFERRHVHNVAVWKDQLWMTGGDAWQGRYNHDVVSSSDGLGWTVELAPGEPPWPPRALSLMGVHEGRLYVAGGQDLIGDPADYTFHNDVWVTEDGVSWTQVAADAPASDTRWEGCGMVDGLVSFRGALWLVGCARYDEVEGHTYRAEVWSSVDGASWTRHADPPWAGKGWHNVVVWRDRLWALFGSTDGDPENGWAAGNANEVWHSADGETWTSLPVDAPVPGSHAQGVAVHPDFLLLAGGNYTFGFGAGEDRSAWRLVPWDGERACAWTARGPSGLTVSAAKGDDCPLQVADGLGPGRPGLHFDGSTQVLKLPAGAVDEQREGRSVFWVARAPYLPTPYGYEDTYAPVATVLGGTVSGGLPNASLGYTDGALVMRALNDAPGPYGEAVFSRFAAGSGLQEGPGEARLVGLTHGLDRQIRAWIDGAPAGSGEADYGASRGWSAIGGSLEGPYYGPYSRFAGTLGAVLVVPGVVDAATQARVHDWARGRFGVP